MRMNTQATKILMKDGKVTGIQVTNKKDGTYTIHAKAVVDAAGGFGANNDLVSKYVPRLKGFATTNHPGATGDGLVLAEKAGAQLIDMTEIQTHPTVVPKVGEMITEAVRGNGAILINKDGKRFFNELNTRDAVSAAILKQKDGVAYLFFDSDMQKSLKATNKYIKQSYCVSGATIEEVAGKMGVPAAELQASIDAWKKGKAAARTPSAAPTCRATSIRLRSTPSWSRRPSTTPWVASRSTPRPRSTTPRARSFRASSLRVKSPAASTAATASAVTPRPTS